MVATPVSKSLLIPQRHPQLLGLRRSKHMEIEVVLYDCSTSGLFCCDGTDCALPLRSVASPL
jgi:hypothetical protein